MQSHSEIQVEEQSEYEQQSSNIMDSSVSNANADHQERPRSENLREGSAAILVMEPSEQSSNEEFSVMRRDAERAARMEVPHLTMKEYPSYFCSAFCLVIGIICALGSLIPSVFPSSIIETNVILYEHRQLYDDWTSKPYVDIVLKNSQIGCPFEYEPIFHRTWNGTHDICLKKSSDTPNLNI